MPAAINVPPGTVFGRLTVVAEAPLIRKGVRAMLCRCECGETKVVTLGHLRSGHTVSCGCRHREAASERMRTDPRMAEYARSDVNRERVRQQMTRHGVSRHPHYPRWKSIMSRCTNPDDKSYRDYGARGVTICQEWRDPAAFCAWIDENLGPCPHGMSIDRKDNNGNYEPGNVKWATAEEQMATRRSPWRPGGALDSRRSQGCGVAKLTEGNVLEIRRRAAAGETHKALGDAFGVARGTVTTIVSGKNWKHLLGRLPRRAG